MSSSSSPLLPLSTNSVCSLFSKITNMCVIFCRYYLFGGALETKFWTEPLIPDSIYQNLKHLIHALIGYKGLRLISHFIYVFGFYEQFRLIPWYFYSVYSSTCVMSILQQWTRLQYYVYHRPTTFQQFGFFLLQLPLGHTDFGTSRLHSFEIGWTKNCKQTGNNFS